MIGILVIPDDLPKDIDVLVNKINESYRSSFYSTELAAEHAMDFAETQKPSDLSKMKEEKEKAGKYIFIASASISDLITKVGLNIEELIP